jgi:hypothetical protein
MGETNLVASRMAPPTNSVPLLGSEAMKSERCREGGGLRLARRAPDALRLRHQRGIELAPKFVALPGHLVELPSELVALSKRDVAFKEESIAIGHCRR